jgi:hypothetical protein
MTIGNTTEDAIVNLIFRATSWTDYATSTGETNISCALHTADPADAGTMATSEAGYASYARVNVARTTGGWVAPSNGVTGPAANIDFPASTGSGTTITNWSTGHTGAAAQPILLSGGVSPSIAIGASGITPRLLAHPSTTITFD